MDLTVRRRLACLTAVVGLAVTGAGCGGSDDDGDTGGTQDEQSAAEQWADDLCTDLGAWTTTVDGARQTLQNPRELSVETVQAIFDEVRTATTTLMDELRALEAPDTEAGDEAAQRLTELADELEQQAATVEEAAGEEPKSVEERLARVSALTGAAATMAAETGSAVGDLRALDGADELRDALADADACQALGS